MPADDGPARSDYAELLAKLDECADLPDNWDSYGAPPIDPRAIAAAKAFVSSMQVVPTNSGGVAVSWLNEAAEVTFDATGIICGVYVDAHDALRESGKAEANASSEAASDG